MLRKLVTSSVLVFMLSCGLVGTSLAACNPNGTGQPNQSCEEQTTRPGNAMTAPGSAFNPDGVSGTVYAGQQSVNSKNPTSASQYDVACFQVSH